MQFSSTDQVSPAADVEHGGIELEAETDYSGSTDEDLPGAVTLLIPNEVQSTPFNASPTLSSSNTAVIAAIATAPDGESTMARDGQRSAV